VALFAGKFIPLKRPLDLIAAAALIKDIGRKITVMVAGAGPLETDMTRFAREAGVPYHSLGFCNQSTMPEVYAAADILVLPSGRETWGLVANEALACGRPVILSEAVGSAPDLAFDQTAGRAYSVGDIVSLARAIDSILRKPPALESIAARSAAYSPAAAANGIICAAEFAARARRGRAA